MLTAAVLSADRTSSAELVRSLQQTGMVYLLREWNTTTHNPSEMIPDLVVLDLPGDPTPYFGFATQLRRLRPSVHIIACSTQQGPEPGLLLQAMRSGVQEFLTRPIEPAALAEILKRFIQEREAAGIRTPDKLIVVMGAKGGVGTTTVAVNLGVQLARLGKGRVVLLDLARPLGHVALMLDLGTAFSLRDAVENLDRLDSHFFTGLLSHHKSGLHVLPGVTYLEEWQRISSEALMRVANVARSTFDYVVLDAGTHCPPDCGALLRQARAIVLVAEANVPSLWTLERHLSTTAAEGVDPARVRIVINRWRRSDDEVLKNVEKRTKRTIFMRLPNHFQLVSEAVNMGVPLSGNHGNSLATKFCQLASQLSGVPLVGEEKRGALNGLRLFNSKG